MGMLAGVAVVAGLDAFIGYTYFIASNHKRNTDWEALLCTLQSCRKIGPLSGALHIVVLIFNMLVKYHAV
jgi:hypothetical protein